MKRWLVALWLCLPAVAKESTPPVPPGCQVRTWGAFDTSGGRCRFSDEVMVGIRSVDPLIIRCARLEVQCRRSVESPAETVRTEP